MFERRLKIILVLACVVVVVLICRLFQLQVLQGREFRRMADEALISPVQYLPPLRGRILDRVGRVLAADEPSHDVVVHYGVLAMDEDYLSLVARRIRDSEPGWSRASAATLQTEVRSRVVQMWQVLARVSDEPMARLIGRRDSICEAIESLRRHVWQKRRELGYDEAFQKLHLKEEELFHPVLRDVTPQQRTTIEVELAGMPFVRIEPSVRRTWRSGADPFCHILGRIGQVSAEQIENDPARADWLRAYRAGDEVGVSGIERLAEQTLRGTRGLDERFLDGSLREHRPPQDGNDVRLTLDGDLQKRIGTILEAAVAASPASTGASCVVLDVATREVLALVSVPTYGWDALRTSYDKLRDDAIRRPLLFRAVQEEYQPGSILKPAALLAGFAHDLVDPEHSEFCDGALVPGVDKWHCWTHWIGMPGHGEVDAETAILQSCNVYFYHLGGRVNPKRLTDFYSRIVLGTAPGLPLRRGTGLLDERFGIIPTREWIEKHRRRQLGPADGRNYAIGQGEVQITPLQAANLYATLATGRFLPATIVASDEPPEDALRFDEIAPEAWELVRRGLFRCVNDESGTAFKHARMDNIDLCGKTGSAQCVPRVVQRRYTFMLEGGETRSITAPTVDAARELLSLPRGTLCVGREIVQRYPAPDPIRGKIPTHSWFAGYAPYEAPRVALAVIIEYGGGGGGTAGPVARQIVQALIDGPRPYLQPRPSRAESLASVQP